MNAHLGMFLVFQLLKSPQNVQLRVHPVHAHLMRIFLRRNDAHVPNRNENPPAPVGAKGRVFPEALAIGSFS